MTNLLVMCRRIGEKFGSGIGCEIGDAVEVELLQMGA